MLSDIVSYSSSLYRLEGTCQLIFFKGVDIISSYFKLVWTSVIRMGINSLSCWLFRTCLMEELGSLKCQR